MYNYWLDAFQEVYKTGSFTKASDHIHISHTAIIKQINQLEDYLGVKLFKRSNHGVIPTKAGQVLYERLPELINLSNDIIRDTQKAYFSSPETIRVGTSVMYPCAAFFSLWDDFSLRCPEFHLQVVPTDTNASYISELGRIYDIVIGSYDVPAHFDLVDFIPVDEYLFHIAMASSHPLSTYTSLKLTDVQGYTIQIMYPGNSPINDQVRDDIVDHYPAITIEDIDTNYNFNTFNNCANTDKLLLSLECWKDIHPGLVSIPLDEPYTMPFGIIVSKKRNQAVEHFIHRIKTILDTQ